MTQQLKQRKEGFTIIEVLIVLAIAGLIILIVFLAVPALQRNSRNTSRRNDVARVLGQVQEVLNNNNNNMAALTDAAIQAGLGNLSFYQAADITRQGIAPTAATNSTNINTVNVYDGSVCTTMTGGGLGATRSGANARSIAVTFMVEPAGNNSRSCQSS